MECKHGINTCDCPICTAIDRTPSGSFYLLRQGEWYPSDLLVFDLDDDVFWPETDQHGLESMDWTNLSCTCGQHRDVSMSSVTTNNSGTPALMEPQGNSNSSDKSNSQSSGNEGIIVNNFYSNQYQNSIDLSANGGNAGTGKSPDGQLSNILGNAVNAFSSALPMLADQNTEEMENLADRVMQDKAGNTATNTQSTVGCLYGYGAKHAGDHPTSCADQSTDNVLAAERYYTFKIADWDSAAPNFSFIRIPLPHVLSGEDGGVFGATLRRHYLVKTGWRAQVQCNASQFHRGCLLVFFAPEFPTANNFQMDTTWQDPNSMLNGTPVGGSAFDNLFVMNHLNPWQWTTYPHQFLNLRTNTSVDLEVPYVNICPTSSWTQHASWTLVVAIVAPLQYSSGAATNVGITVSLQPVKPVFNGLRHEAVQAQGPIPVTIREHQGMWVSTLPDTTVPIYGKTPAAPHNYMVGQFKDLLELAKIPTFMGNALSSTGSNNRLPYFNVNTTFKDEPLATFQVTLACACLTNTMLAAVGRNYAQYRGSVVYNFMFAGTAMHKGKFLIAYTPPGAGKPTTRQQAMQATYVVWDLGLNSTYKFVVPFISPTHYRLTTYSDPSIVNVDGWVTVWQLTPLTYPPGSPTSAAIITMASAGDDFTFKLPITPKFFLPQGIDNAETGAMENTDATADFVAEPLPLPQNQTKIKFFYDRFSSLGAFQATQQIDYPYAIGAGQAGPNNCLLTPLPAWNDNYDNSPVATIKQHRVIGVAKSSATGVKYATRQDLNFLAFSPFTYFKCDLDVAIVPSTNLTSNNVCVQWVPTGAPEPVQTVLDNTGVSSLRSTRNPTITAGGSSAGSVISFTVPYNSPLSVLPASWYNGYPVFDNSSRFWDTSQMLILVICIYKLLPNVRWNVFVRYKNMKVFCPRPSAYCDWPPRNESRMVNVSPFPVLSVQMPDPRFRIDVFIFFDATHIEFKMKIHGMTINQWKNTNPGLTESGRFLVALGELPRYHWTHKQNSMMHVTFETDGFLIESKVYKGRKRYWKEPIRAETHFHPINSPRDLSDFILGIYSKYYADRLLHDVETNPGPVMSVFQPQGGVLTKTRAYADNVKGALGDFLVKSIGENSEISEVIQMLNQLTEVWNNAKTTLESPEFWTKALLKTVKFIAATVLWVHNPDLTTTLCLAVMSGVDIVTENTIFSWLKKYLSKAFRTPAPPAPQTPQDPLRDTNGAFLLARNLEWASKLIKSIVDWVTQWFTQEKQSPQAKLDEMLKDFPEHADKIMRLRSGEESYVNCKLSFEYFEKLYPLAVQCNKIQLASLCEKFKYKHNHNVARVEPVCIVLRGKAGQGKSLASQLIAQSISKLILGRQSVYSMPPDTQYLDGYENQFSVIMDDLGQNPNGEDFRVFCQMVSSTNFLPDMAHLDRKGTPFTSQCIVATTNLPTFTPPTITCGQAIQRRITFDYTVTAGDVCTDDDGRLDMEMAMMESSDDPPKLSCFTKDCHILHQSGLKFKCKHTNKTFNLTEVIEKAIDKIKHKAECINEFNTLVAQSPGAPDIEHVLTSLRQRIAATRDELEELQDAFAMAQERSTILSDWLKISAIIFAALASLSTVIKIVSKVKSTFWPAPAEVILAENEQAAYSGKPRTVKTALNVLEVQGQGHVVKHNDMVLTTQSGNPVFDYEIYVAKHVVSPITLYYQDGSSITQTCLLLKDRLLVLNRHTAETDWVSLTVRQVNHSREQVKCLSVNKRGRNVDLTFIKLLSGPFFKNNVEKFANCENPLPSVGQALTGIMNTGIPYIFDAKTIHAGDKVGTTTGQEFNCVIQYRANTKKGWCGSAIIATQDGKKIIYGLHSAGGAGVAAATLVTQELIAKVETFFSMEPQGALVDLPPGPVVHVPRRTKLRRTVAHAEFEPPYEPAVLSRYDPRTQCCVDEVAFSKHTQNIENLPPVFHMVAKEYANRVFTLLGRDNALITTKEALFGLPGMDPMEMDTSPGLPYTQMNLKRKDLVDQNGNMSLLLLSNYNKLRNGDYSDVLYQSFLKDEIRHVDKINLAKTRVVDVPPYHHCIFGRQLLGKFAARFQSNPGLQLGSAIGLRPDVHWTSFAAELSRYKYVYDVDYSNFDASHGTGTFQMLIENFFTVENGFDQQVAQYLWSLAVSTHAYEDRRMLVEGGLPSGCAATSLLNTIINNIVIRAALYLTYANFEFDDVKILAYGDDLLVASNYEIDFNLVKDRISKFGYKITPASKTDVFPSVSFLSDVTFLKRSFVFEDGFLVRPVMNEENLKAMVSYCRPGTLKEKLTSIAMLAVHSGRRVYDLIFEPFRKIGMIIPDYDTMNYRWQMLFR
ncbi:polyprotein [cardiovirus E1]|uniref:Genome polyprotein n=1 Tax=cardiovirus E1 TaxID=2870386 RepID=A0A2H4RDU1_9PICO|nr:polyprotein [cardiovirus E1]ATY47696.1 polyprotein [cardiovirus E1]